MNLTDLYNHWRETEGKNCPKSFSEMCLENRKPLVEAIFDDIDSALAENRSNYFMGEVCMDYFRIELIDAIKKIEEKYNIYTTK